MGRLGFIPYARDGVVGMAVSLFLIVLVVHVSPVRSFMMPTPLQPPFQQARCKSPLSSASSTTMTTTPACSMPTIVICPGFGNAVEDYIAPFGPENESIGFRRILEQRGFSSIRIVPVVNRWEWLRVIFGGILGDPVSFWRNQQHPTTGMAYGWYVRRIQDTIHKCPPDQEVLVVAHSAGGWLARAALADADHEKESSLSSSSRPTVCGLVTLGAPHIPPPNPNQCVTRGALQTTNGMYPGAYRKDIVYVTVAGNAVTVTGNKDTSSTTTSSTTQPRPVDEIYAKRGERNAENVARINYESLLGAFNNDDDESSYSGDGVIPIDIAHLEGAEQITLDGVFHSINEAGTTMPTDSWYGSDKVVDLWLSRTLELLQQRATSKQQQQQ
jgi:pimeloyl-ACP methyl ester carboxylesterase